MAHSRDSEAISQLVYGTKQTIREERALTNDDGKLCFLPIYGNSVEGIPREIEGHPLTELWFSVAHFR